MSAHRHSGSHIALEALLRRFTQQVSLPQPVCAALVSPADWHHSIMALCAQPHIVCAHVLEACREPLQQVCPGEPQGGWLAFCYEYARHLLYPDADFSAAAAPWQAGAELYLRILQLCLDAERTNRKPNPLMDFQFLSEAEAAGFERAGEYRIFLHAWREEYVYEMLRLGDEVTPFRTLGHIAGVHHVAMTAARGLLAAGLPVDLALASGAAAGHDIGKYGCRPGERVPYLHYYYTDQWFRRIGASSIGAVGANHSTWDLELDNLSVEALCLIYADFRVKQERDADGCELTRIYGLDDSFRLILSKLDNVDEAKLNRYKFVYARLHDFEDYMRTKGVDVDLTGRTPAPAPMPDISLRSVPQAVQSLLFQGMEQNILVMAILTRDGSFANLLESARTEKDWRSIRTYLDIFGEYSIYLHPRQKAMTLDFLYELLMNREGDIRRRAAELLGQLIGQYNAGYRKERPAGTPDPAEATALELWESLLHRLVSPDPLLMSIQKSWIRYTLKLVVQSLFRYAPAQDQPELFHVLLSFYTRSDLSREEAFPLLDNLYDLPLSLCSPEQLHLLMRFARHYYREGSLPLRIAAARFYKQLAAALPPESEHLAEIADFYDAMQGESDLILQFLRFRVGQGLGYSQPELEHRLNREEALNEIFLDNLKTGTHWIRKAVSIKLLADRAPHCEGAERLHIATHLANLVKVSENIVVRYDAGAALQRIAPLLTAEHRNEICVELFKGLETGEYEFSKYIPNCLGQLGLWLPPQELNELVQSLRESLSSSNERVVCVALDTVSVLLEYSPLYPGRYTESEEEVDLRRRYLLGFLLAGLANHRPLVRHQSLLDLSKLFASQQLSLTDKKVLFGLCCKKLLFLLGENPPSPGGEYYRAAALTQICRFINICGSDAAALTVPEWNKVAFFPGTFDPFTLGHKGIVRAIRNLGFEVYLAVDEFSWSKNAQPHLIRRQIVNMSVPDMFHVHIFPSSIPVNLACEADLARLRSLFPGKELYLVAGSDVIANASAYKKPVSENSIHTFHHILFKRNSQDEAQQQRDREARKCLTGKIVELTLPPELEDISSTRIRDNLDQGRDISQLIDPVVQEYIYSSGVYLRAARFKPGLVESPGKLQLLCAPTPAQLKALFDQLPLPAARACAALPASQWVALQNSGRLLALGAFRALGSGQLMSAVSTPEAAAALRRRAGGAVLLLQGIWLTHLHTVDSLGLVLSEMLSYGLLQGCTHGLWVGTAEAENAEIRTALALRGFIPAPELSPEALLCDMHQPIVVLRNLQATFKQPLAHSPVLRQVAQTTHTRLMRAAAGLFPGNLVLDLSSAVIQQSLAERITRMNGVPETPTSPRVLGPMMCVPFGKLLRGRVVPNTVTKTLHTDRVFAPDLSASRIDAFPGYSDLQAQIRTLKSFERPVILVDDLLHRPGRLNAVLPLLRQEGVQIGAVMLGILSGLGADTMAPSGLPVSGIYNIPNLRYWFVDSTLYPFIGGDTVRRARAPVSGLLPTINQILPYTYPGLEGCSQEAVYEFSQVCLENARDVFLALESEYRQLFGRNLTLERLAEAVVLPTCPDRGACMGYSADLPASAYLENDLEQLLRTRRIMKK